MPGIVFPDAHTPRYRLIINHAFKSILLHLSPISPSKETLKNDYPLNGGLNTGLPILEKLYVWYDCCCGFSVSLYVVFKQSWLSNMDLNCCVCIFYGSRFWSILIFLRVIRNSWLTITWTGWSVKRKVMLITSGPWMDNHVITSFFIFRKHVELYVLSVIKIYTSLTIVPGSEK